ncbi:O-antigen ligase family protein [Salinibacterium sp. dk2585]|uniref:O-antigen ligase family protein n=1 Tax=unclassified Salinibacterium TaxID=2632331 RepID=UPI0011C24819|nr:MULTISPECIES: O-antigen ligase family protein [unclassified Salinibacterium]QEE60861.1 O-antigen ligase family protein [Salinibacterium sp. dk2585]TXK55933.1 O-antigen ligase family protein [Salinibacterium sp. dk5596]
MATPGTRLIPDAGWAFFASAAFTKAATLAALGIVFLAHPITAMIGWWGYGAMLATLALLCGVSLYGRRGEIEWQGMLPISLLVFVGWSAASVVWSQYNWASLGGVAYQVAVAFLGVYIALSRDLLQLVRAVGDVLRVVLILSLAMEVFAGLLIDMPIPFLGISGNLPLGGPLEGLMGTRNQFGVVAAIAVMTFFVEVATRSVSRWVSATSLAGALLVVVLTQSPVTIGVLAVLAVATAVLFGIRRASEQLRQALNIALVVVVGATLVIVWVARQRILDLLNAGSEFELRYTLWMQVLGLSRLHPIEGFGWVGIWPRDVPPYSWFLMAGRGHASALNGFVDVALQLGLVGLAAFVALLGLALVRSWLLATRRRTIIYVWPALVLLVLAVTSLAESSLLVGFGWLTLVICCVMASRNLSWRTRLPRDAGTVT